MTEDTDWLKKNPRMSLWRTSRFFCQDMDASLMANEQKSKNDVLVVSHVPRRSNIPMDKIKQMDFKFPVPASKKTGIKKPVTRASKFLVPQVVVSRPSTSTKSGETKAVTQKQGFVKPSGRPSVFNKPSAASASSGNVLKSNTLRSTPITAGKFNHLRVKSSADVSLLSQSKVVNQSTPNEAAIPRSILKQKRASGKTSTRSHLDSKKSTAAKRVIFNEDGEEKENRECEVGSLSADNKTEDHASRSSPQPEKKENLRPQPDEESTVAFTSSFKPLPDNEVMENREEEESVVVKVKKCDDDGADNANGKPNESSKSIFSKKLAIGLRDLWKIYHDKVNDIRNELQLIDENFQTTVQLTVDSQIADKLVAYEKEKCKLFEKLKDLEVDFRAKVKDQTDIKTLFLTYLDKKKSILCMQSELEENFEKALRTITEKYGEVPGFEDQIFTDKTGTDTEQKTEETDKKSEHVEEAPGVVVEKKTAKRASGARRKSECSSRILKRSTPRKRNSGQMKASGVSTPDNTPGSRRKLSRKIEKQLRNLFEE